MANNVQDFHAGTRWERTLQAVEFCGSCGKSFSTSEKFCTNCGSSRTAQNPAPLNTTPVGSISEPVSPEVIFKEPKKDFRKVFSIKVVAIILVPVLLLLLGGGTFWFTSVRVNNEAKTLSDLFFASESRTEKFVSDSCPSFKAKLDSTNSEISAKSISINFDYTEALDSYGMNTSYVDVTFENWADDLLSAKLGKRANNLKYAKLLQRNILKEVEQFCNFPRKIQSIFAQARKLDNTIDDIKNPGNWQPDGFWKSDEDPNIAYRWAPNYSYSCSSASDGCVRVQIVTRLKCKGSVNVKLGLMYTRDGSVQDYEYGDISYLTPGRVYGLTVNHYGYEYDWWRFDSVYCNY